MNGAGKKKDFRILDTEDTRERSQRRDNAELTLSFQDLLFIMLQWLCLVELGD